MNRISDETATALERYLVSMFESRKETLDGRTIVKLIEFHREYNHEKAWEASMPDVSLQVDYYKQVEIAKRWKIAAIANASIAVLTAAISVFCWVI